MTTTAQDNSLSLDLGDPPPGIDAVAAALETLASRLRLDLIILDAQHRPRVVTHRGSTLMSELTATQRARLVRRLSALSAEHGTAIAHVSPDLLTGWEVYAFPLLDGMAIVLSGPQFPRVPLGAGLRALYALTPAESRIAAALAADKTPKEIAVDFGVGLSTVRTHLRVIQSKVGANSQTDLVRRLLSSAAIFVPDPPASPPKSPL